jgi:hypothetical protein
MTNGWIGVAMFLSLAPIVSCLTEYFERNLLTRKDWDRELPSPPLFFIVVAIINNMSSLESSRYHICILAWDIRVV